MRKFTIFTAIAPLALLAACGDDEREEAALEEDTMAADTAANDTAMDTGAEATPTRLSDAGDYSGVYSYTGSDGSETAIRLNSSNNTYEYVGSDNQVQSGTYTTTPDGYRIHIADFKGSPAWFTVSNGSLVKMQQDTEISDPSMTVSGERYNRAQEGDAVFSRFPEPGSPVAPQDL